MVQNIAIWLGAYKRPPPALPSGKKVQDSVDELRAMFPDGIKAQDLG